MKTWKLAAIFMALVSVLTFSSCGSDDEPRCVANTQWEKVFNPAEYEAWNKGSDFKFRDFDLEEAILSEASIKLDFISKTQATFIYKEAYEGGYYVQIKYLIPFDYNTTTGAVMLKFSDRESLAIEHNLPDGADQGIDPVLYVNSLGQVDWDKNTLSLTLVDEEVGTHPVILTKK